MKEILIKIKREPGCKDLPLPKYQTPGSSGLDLYAAVDKQVTLKSGDVKLIPAGIRIAIPFGYEGQVRPRSGLALKHRIGLLNSPGTIDSDYRGEIGVILFNFGKKLFKIRRGDRIAQLVIVKVEKALFKTSDELDQSEREAGGFGSTGI